MDVAKVLLDIGDIVDTPYGPGVILEANKTIPQNVKVNVRGTDFEIKQIGLIPIGKMDLP
jgi:hypothetical protein